MHRYLSLFKLQTILRNSKLALFGFCLLTAIAARAQSSPASAPTYAWVTAAAPGPNVVQAPQGIQVLGQPGQLVCRGTGDYGRLWVGYWDGNVCVGTYGWTQMYAPNNVQFLVVVSGPPVWSSTMPSNSINGGNNYVNMPQVICSNGGAIGWVEMGLCQTAVIIGANSATYLAGTVVAQPTTPLLAQTITFPEPASPVDGVSPVTLSATASSGLGVGFSVSGPAVVNGNTLSFNGSGPVVVTASQPGNTVYSAAASIQKTFTGNVTAPVYLWVSGAAPPSNAVTAPGSTLAVCRGTDGNGSLWAGYWNGTQCDGSDSGNLMPATNNVQFLALVSGTASLMWTSGSGKNDPTDIGNVPSNTINAGNTYFNTAQMICSQGGYIGWINSNQCMISGASLGGQQNSVVLIGSVLTAQTITFPAPVVSANASMPVFLQATATSGLPVSYTILGPATLNRGMVTFTGYGTVTVTATQAGNSAYGPAPPVQVSFSAPPAGYAWIPAPVPPPNAVTAPDAPNKAVCRGMDSAQRSWVGYWDGAKCVGSYGGMTMPAPTFVMFLQVMGSVQMQPVWVSGTAKVQPGNIGTVPSNTINGGNTYTNMPQVICSMGGYVGWVYSNQCSIGGASLNMQQNATVLIGVVP